MADRVRAGGAGVGDDLAGGGDAERFLRVHDGLLRRVVGDQRSGARAGGLARLQPAIILLAEGHAAAGRAHHRELRPETRALGERLLERENHHLRDPMQPLGVEVRLSGAGQTRVGNLARGLASATVHRKAR